MNRDIAELWVAALESGNYRQARTVLVLGSEEDGNLSYCCLGVLCDLAFKAGAFAQGCTDWEELTDGVTLPDEVIAWSEMKTNGGQFGDRNTGDPWLLSGLNDSGATFAEVAQVIRDKVDIL